MNVQQINGKVVALTGAARGIGLATAKALVARGAKVGGGDLDPTLLAKEFETLGGETATFALDVTDRESFAAFLDGVEEQLGPIDVLVNNAGIMALGSFLDEDDATADRMIDVNYKGPMYGMKLVVPRMIQRGDGHVITIVSGTARVALPGAVTYSSTKYGVYGLMEGVASELRDTPVAFTAILPAVVQTDLTVGVQSKTRGVKTLLPEEVAEAILEAIEKRPFDMTVPKSMKATLLMADLTPRKVRPMIARITNADKIMVNVDHNKRLGYEQRNQLSEGKGPKQLEGAGDGE
jgi:NADP-dependent 3-hydroxy acid dehydrogenase YdfG